MYTALDASQDAWQLHQQLPTDTQQDSPLDTLSALPQPPRQAAIDIGDPSSAFTNRPQTSAPAASGPNVINVPDSPQSDDAEQGQVLGHEQAKDGFAGNTAASRGISQQSAPCPVPDDRASVHMAKGMASTPSQQQQQQPAAALSITVHENRQPPTQRLLSPSPHPGLRADSPEGAATPSGGSHDSRPRGLKRPTPSGASSGTGKRQRSSTRSPSVPEVKPAASETVGTPVSGSKKGRTAAMSGFEGLSGHDAPTGNVHGRPMHGV